jgi:hypothetical protein
MARVLKKLRRPLIAAHHRQIKREPSLDLLMFQIARTTISPNYPGEMFEISDREVLVVSTNPRSRTNKKQQLTQSKDLL